MENLSIIPFLPEIIEQLNDVNLLVEDQGAQCVFLEGFKNKAGDPQPLIVQKSDGGYNYATTDLAALRYRIQDDQAQRIIVITDSGLGESFCSGLSSRDSRWNHFGRCGCGACSVWVGSGRGWARS